MAANDQDRNHFERAARAILAMGQAERETSEALRRSIASYSPGELRSFSPPQGGAVDATTQLLVEMAIELDRLRERRLDVEGRPA